MLTVVISLRVFTLIAVRESIALSALSIDTHIKRVRVYVKAYLIRHAFLFLFPEYLSYR